MKSFTTFCIVAIIALIAVIVNASYDPKQDPVPGPNPSTIPGLPLSPFDEPIQTAGPEAIVNSKPIEGVVYKKAILMVENNCKLRNQFRGARTFLHHESGYYPELYTKLVSGLPRIKFFENETDFKQATVDPSQSTPEEMLQVLQKLLKDPKAFDPTGAVEEVLIARETTSEELIALMERFGIQRTMNFDLAKRPDIAETSDDRSDGRKFEHDDILRQLNPEHDVALPPEGYDYDAEIEKREAPLKDMQAKEVEEFEAQQAALLAKQNNNESENTEKQEAKKDEL